MWESVFFWIFSVVAVALGVLVITFRNPVHSAMALIGNLFCVAALFALLDAHFLAAIQVLVYAEAIMVLFMFVIMLLNLKPDELGPARQNAAKITGGVLLGWIAIRLIMGFTGSGMEGAPEIDQSFGTLESTGRLIFNQYLLPFEVASVLLLAAILGAVSIAKKKLW